MSNEASESSGVQQLIDRLHHQGVAKGKEEAEALVTAARQQALEIMDEAKRQADAMLQSAREEAERTRRSGEEALRMAGRDATLELMESLREDFVRRLHHLVQHQLEDESFLRQMLLEITRQAVTRDDQEGVHLVFLGDADSDAYPTGSLDDFARGLAADAVRQGLTFSTSDSETSGIRVQFVEDDLEVDLTEETLTALLMKHLSPKFREILQTR